MALGRPIIITMSIMPNMPRNMKLLSRNAILMPSKSISIKKWLECLLNLLLLLDWLQLTWPALPLISKLNIKTLPSELLTCMSSMPFGCNPTQVAAATNTKLQSTFSIDCF